MPAADNAAGVIYHLNERIAAKANPRISEYLRFEWREQPLYVTNLVQPKVPDNHTLFGVFIPPEMIDAILPDDHEEIRKIVVQATKETLGEQHELVGQLITSYARIGENFFDAADA